MYTMNPDVHNKPTFSTDLTKEVPLVIKDLNAVRPVVRNKDLLSKLI